MKPARGAKEQSRRDLLSQAGLAAIILAAGGPLNRVSAHTAPAQSRVRTLRLVHVTDIHVKPELHAAQGMAACLRHAQQHARPDLVLNTGDTIYDSMAAELSTVHSLWNLSLKVWKDECSIPVEHAIGNHDIWGIDKAQSKTTGREPLYGKKWIMSLYGWEKPYRSFDRGGWHFIALDSVSPGEGKYTGQIDQEQFAWLESDLAKVNPTTPILLFSHIPLLSAAAFFVSEAEKTGNWQIPASVMLIDARRMKNLFLKYPNVKLCLSGHLHLVDRVEYLGVTYLCHGAVCGRWWKGKFQECHPGYGVVDLYSDGTFENRYVAWGWKKQK
ncbi:MAG: metallophosphoesterase [Phycisphaerae bacterium]|nr:metallophosphoesterase [Phycisphaerae bacterium]